MISDGMNKSHKKHASLKRPPFGNFGRNEWALVGAPCITIKLLSDRIIKALCADYKIAYVDTVHNDEVTVLPGRLENGAWLDYSDELGYKRLNHKAGFNTFKLRETFNQSDFVLVNGNHHQAKAQVVIIQESKKSSLQKRIEQLTDVALFLLAEGSVEIFDFVKEAIPNWQAVPTLSLEDAGAIIDFFRSKIQQAKPKLNGLVLAGGKSERMGFDKAAINWHGREQHYHMTDLLNQYCNEVHISCRAEQQIDAGYNRLTDTFTGLGPYGGMLSAFREQPDAAWLVVACDLPLLSERTLNNLVKNRNVSSVATTYKSPFDNFPEPLITIWEPKSYPVLLSFLSQGYSCPRKVLINTDVKVLDPPYPDELTNVNTPEDLEKVKAVLNAKAIAK